MRSTNRSHHARLRTLAHAVATLMLLGGASPTRMRRAAETIAARLPNARLREIPRHQHVAMLSAPQAFATAVNEFLDAT